MKMNKIWLNYIMYVSSLLYIPHGPVNSCILCTLSLQFLWIDIDVHLFPALCEVAFRLNVIVPEISLKMSEFPQKSTLQGAIGGYRLLNTPPERAEGTCTYVCVSVIQSFIPFI